MAKNRAIAIKNLAKVSNVEFWDEARKYSPSFASHTSKGTSDMFTEKGFEAISRMDIGVINEFIGISMRVGFQMVTTSRARNPLEGSGLVQVYDTPNGGFVQRMGIDSLKPVSPAYKNLKNFESIDPYVVRKPETSERFFAQNFDYQSLVTIQDFQVKTIFTNEYGMGQWMSGVMQALENGYTIQEYENTLEALNAAIHSEEHPIQDTQNIQLGSWTGEGTADELKAFILACKNLASQMETTPQTSAYNAGKFASVVDRSDLVMLVRPSVKNRIEVELEVGAFNPDRLTLPFEIKEVDNFGGLEPVTDGGEKLYPVFDKLGTQIGWNTQDGQDEVTVELGKAKYNDPNKDVIAVIAQKGLIFENAQNPYTVTPIYNPRGMYQNYWANRPNTGINVDYFYDLVLISKPGV